MGPMGESPQSPLSNCIACPENGSKSVPSQGPRLCQKVEGLYKESQPMIWGCESPRASEDWAILGYRVPSLSFEILSPG